MTASLPTLARATAVLCWIVIAAVLIRIVSGGGSLVGIRYVLSTESRFAILAGAVILATAPVVAVALLLHRPWAWRASLVCGAAALAGSVILVIDGHASGVVAATAASLGLAIGIAMTNRADTPG